MTSLPNIIREVTASARAKPWDTSAADMLDEIAERYEPIDLVLRQGFVLNPGSRVLIGVKDGMSADEAQRMMDTLTARFPGVEFTFVDGTVTVQEGDRG